MRNLLIKTFLLFTTVFIFSCIEGGKDLGFTITVTPEELNSYLKKEFPVSQKLKLGEITLKDPEVASIDKNEKLNIGLSFDYKVPLLPSINGKILVAGGIKYNPKEKAIFLKNPEIKDFTVFNKRVPSLLSAESRRLMNDVISFVFGKIPVYRFDKKSIYGKFIKDIRVKDGKLLVRFGL